MKFHHIGIPTDQRHEGEEYLEGGKVFYTDPEASEYRIEWLRFEPDSPMPEELRTRPHPAFLVDDIQAAIEGKNVLIEPFEVFEGLTIAFIMEDTSPVELMQMAEE